MAWQNGIITEGAFDSVVTVAGEDYLYLQIHHKKAQGLYDIENSVYHYRNESLSDAALTDVRGFERIPPVVHTNSDKRQFVIDRLNIANNFDYALPVGIPVFANAIDILKGVDRGIQRQRVPAGYSGERPYCGLGHHRRADGHAQGRQRESLQQCDAQDIQHLTRAGGKSSRLSWRTMDNQNFWNLLNLYAVMLQILDVALLTGDISNRDIVGKLEEQNKVFPERIVAQNDEIIRLLTGE